MGSRRGLSLAALAIGGSLLAASGYAATSDGVARRGGTLRYASQADVIESVDPAVAYGLRSWELEYATCALLYNYPDQPAPVGMRVVPEVAAGFPRVSRDGRTHTIQLRHTYRFHTGAPITAASFVAAVDRLRDPRLESDAMTYLQEIASVSAVGRYTLRIVTTKRLPDLVSRLSMPFFCPVAVGTPARELTRPLGSGPYWVAERILNDRTRLERNRFYRGPRPAYVDRLVIDVGMSPEACVAAVERNEVDRCWSELRPHLAGPLIRRYGRNRGRFFLGSSISSGYLAYFVFNHRRPAFAGSRQVPLKQAVNHVVDRRSMADAVGLARTTDQVLPPGLRRDVRLYPLVGVSRQSLARARALRDRAPYRPTALTLYVVRPLSPLAQIFRQNLRQLGIDVDVKEFAPAVLTERVRKPDEQWDVALPSRWFLDYADPVTVFAPLFRGNGSWNFGRFDRARYNRAIDRIQRLAGNPRLDAWFDLDAEMMRNDPPVVPVANGLLADFVSRSVGCYFIHPIYGVDIAALCKK